MDPCGRIPGFESTFTVNVLANHLSVRLDMVPGPAWKPPAVLARTSPFPKPDTTAAGRTAYATSKPAALYLVHEHARRLPAGVDAIAHGTSAKAWRPPNGSPRPCTAGACALR